MEILILCSVVDNYGDIGFVYRLGRSLLELDGSLKIKIAVDNLSSFSRIAPGIESDRDFQLYRGLEIFDWNNEDFCRKEFSECFPSVVLQCFQCTRPNWLDEILFSPENKKMSLILNVEYLTAEDWAEDFHLLKSGTRSSLVKKINFMPGFTPATGGLILDKSFSQCLKAPSFALSLLSDSLKDNLHFLQDPFCFCLVFFAYPKNFNGLVQAFKKFQMEKRISCPEFSLTIFAADGISFEPFYKAWENSGKAFKLVKLPPLRQEAWDALLTLSDFNFIRGEDSFSRACLAGKPFMWHVYPQDEEFQIVKLDALLKRMEKFFSLEDYQDFRRACLLYNRRFSLEAGQEACNILDREYDFPEAESENEECKAMFNILEKGSSFADGFFNFSKDIISNGNLAEALLKFINTFDL